MATSPVPPADGAADLNLVDALVQLSFLVQGLLGQAGAGSGLTTVQMRLLGVLRGREPAMREIASAMGLDKSSVTGLVDRAEARGLVRRTTSTEDGRSVRVALTRKGQRLADTTARDLGRRITEATEVLSAKETEQLRALAARVIGSVDRKAG